MLQKHQGFTRIQGNNTMLTDVGGDLVAGCVTHGCVAFEIRCAEIQVTYL